VCGAVGTILAEALELSIRHQRSPRDPSLATFFYDPICAADASMRMTPKRFTQVEEVNRLLLCVWISLFLFMVIV
jgi:hypothetical protein